MRAQRIQPSRRKGWRKPAHAIVAARPTRWGNPYGIDQWGCELAIRLFDQTAHGVWNPALLVDSNDEQVAVAHRAHDAWLFRLGAHPLELIPRELSTRDLACWCRLDQPCYADVLLQIANG